MTEDRIGLYIVTIVSIVAIVGLVTIYLDSGASRVALAPEEEANIAGQATAVEYGGFTYGFGPSSYQDIKTSTMGTEELSQIALPK